MKKAIYQNYDLYNYDSGVGILILPEPIDFGADGDCTCKLCLSQKTPSVGDTCIVAGWGDETTTSKRTKKRKVVSLLYPCGLGALRFDSRKVTTMVRRTFKRGMIPSGCLWSPLLVESLVAVGTR